MRPFAAIILAHAVLLGSLTHGPACAAPEAMDPFFEVASEHFRGRYTLATEEAQVKAILQRAEVYYDRVAHDIGYSRYEDAWTWDRRAVIILYPDQQSFQRFTGAPGWSKGYAGGDTRITGERTIVSYDGQENFIGEALPHEITHLMLRDYWRAQRARSDVPVWFEEGVAQLEEEGKRGVVQDALRPVVAAGKHIPFASLQAMAVSGEQDPVKVSLFYAQSLSIVVFLIQKYGQDPFHRLCRALREGMPFEPALARAYPSVIDSMSALEERWVKHFAEQ